VQVTVTVDVAVPHEALRVILRGALAAKHITSAEKGRQNNSQQGREGRKDNEEPGARIQESGGGATKRRMGETAIRRIRRYSWLLSLSPIHFSPVPPTPDHSFPILRGSDSDQAHEGFAQSVGVSESAL
jgi:hypothetical protein